MVLDGIERETSTGEAEGEVQSRATNPNLIKTILQSAGHALNVCCYFNFSFLNLVLNWAQEEKAPSPGLGGVLFPVQTNGRCSCFTPVPVKLDREWGKGSSGTCPPSQMLFCCSSHELQPSPDVSFEAINLYLSWRFLITAKTSYLNLYYRERDHLIFGMKQRPLARGKQQIFQHTQHSWVWCFFLNLWS